MPVPWQSPTPEKQHQGAQQTAQPQHQQQQQPQEGPRDQPKLTAEQLTAWLARQGAPTAEALAAAAAQRQQALKEGRIPVEEMTGKELHEHHPELFSGY